MAFTIDTTNNVIAWTGGGEYVRIEPWGDNSVRVRSRMMHEPQEGIGALEPCNIDVSRVVVEYSEETQTAILRNNNLIVEARASEKHNDASGYNTNRCELTFKKADGTVLFKEIDGGGSLQLKARDYKHVKGGGHELTVSFETPEHEHLYGMGEYQQPVMDLKGSTFELAHRNSQSSVPFVVSSQGYGFLWNNPAIGDATFAKNRTSWHAMVSEQIDYWVTCGDSPSQIISQYADATGHPPMMPEWGLGFWQCKLRYWNQQQVLDVAEQFHKRNIPLDVIVVDFFHWPKMGDYRFEPEFWPNPELMARRLHELGIKLMVSVWPQVSLESENYDEMRSKNLLIKAEQGEDFSMMFEGPSQYYDATNPRARQFVWDLCKRNYVNNGVDAFWLDEAEPEYGSYDFDNYRYYAGSNLQIGNIYPREYNRGFYEGQIALGREGQIVNLTRCAWAGSQRYASLVWSGDVGSTFTDLRAQITCAIHMGMAGIPWFTTDMGGFHDGDINSEQFRELFLRWAQFSCFSPVMRNHGDRSALAADGSMKETITTATGEHRSPSGADNEPWSMGKQVEEILVKYIQLREKLRPYTRELFEQAHKSGTPLIRGLFFEFPHDEAAVDISDEYMFGPDLLVAPITEYALRERDVYLPGDNSTVWVDLHTGRSYAGGITVRVDAPLDVIPVFARNNQHHDLLGL